MYVFKLLKAKVTSPNNRISSSISGIAAASDVTGSGGNGGGGFCVLSMVSGVSGVFWVASGVLGGVSILCKFVRHLYYNPQNKRVQNSKIKILTVSNTYVDCHSQTLGLSSLQHLILFE